MTENSAKLRPVRPASVKEAAKYAHVGLRTVYEWIESGRLPAWRLGPNLTQVCLDDVDGLYEPVLTRLPRTGIGAKARRARVAAIAAQRAGGGAEARDDEAS
jgi:excisionase family DNA binding protein